MARLLAFFSFIIISFVLVQSASAQTTPRPDFVLPATCGAFEREGFEFTRGQISNDENADFESGLAGPQPFDPLVIEPLVQRDAATGVVSFFQSSADASGTGSIDPSGVLLTTANDLTQDNQNSGSSEFWRFSTRLHGTPGVTETISFDNGGAQEHVAFWQTDVNGVPINIANNSGNSPGNDDGWLFGAFLNLAGSDGTTTDVDVVYPADGVVILHFAIFDATRNLGGLEATNYTCPTSSAGITKTLASNADEDGSNSVSIGDTLTYTVTGTNTGSVPQTNFTVTDPLITPSTNTCGTVPVGGTCVLTGTYVVQAGDAGGDIVNTAEVSSDQVTTPVSATQTAAVDPAAPALDIVKTLTNNADGDGSSSVSIGDVLTYSIVATNSGNIEQNNVDVTDNLITPNSNTCATVAVGGTCTLTGTYVCLLYTSPSPRDQRGSRMPSSA